MKKCILHLALIGLSLLLSSCPVEPEIGVPDPILTNDYKGSLQLRFTNTFPAFDESISMDAEIDKSTGLVDIDSGTLSYLGDETNTNTGLRMRREGTISVHPYAHLEEINGELYVQVIENADLNEHLQTWVNGQSVLDQNITDTWDGGLSFKFLESQTGGAVINAANAHGSVTWTLLFVPEP